MLLAFSVVAITTIAEPSQQPEQPALRFEQPVDAKLDHVDVVQRVGVDHVRVKLTFTLRVDTTSAHDIALAIDVPRDVAVVGMNLSLGELDSSARIAWSDAARKTYDAIVDRDRDPALLEWIDATATHQHLRLRVFPVTSETPATVTIELVAPRTILVESKDWLAVAQTTSVTSLPRPVLGFGHQLGRKMSLIATDRAAGSPAYTRMMAWNNVQF